MARLIIATQNEGKVREFRALLGALPVELVSPAAFPGFNMPPETGQSFRANAIIKARAAWGQVGQPALADDSGLEVDALGGAPGVYSSRFAGEPSDDAKNNEKLLKLLKDVPDGERTARFRCALALVDASGELYLAEGTLEGLIAFAPRGSHGFGYDPLFFLPDYGRTLAEVELAVKDSISHRARAAQVLKPTLAQVFGRSWA